MVSYKALNTTIESTFSNTCHGIRNRDWGEAAAFFESAISNSCDIIFWIFKSNRFGNHYVTWIISDLRYCGGCSRNVIVNPIHLNNICRCWNWEEHAKNERCQTCSKSFFHNFFLTHISATRSGVGVLLFTFNDCKSTKVFRNDKRFLDFFLKNVEIIVLAEAYGAN